MTTDLRLLDLSAMHPRLLWDDLGCAAAEVLGRTGAAPPFPVELIAEAVSGFGTKRARFRVDSSGFGAEILERVRRTYDPARLVEMAAVALAALACYHAGRHEIRDVALRGSGADYLVDESGDRLEIAGRSRRADVTAAWDQRWERLDGVPGGRYVCVAEFETPAVRLGFRGG